MIEIESSTIGVEAICGFRFDWNTNRFFGFLWKSLLE